VVYASVRACKYGSSAHTYAWQNGNSEISRVTLGCVEARRPPKTRTPPAPPPAPVQIRRPPKTRTPPAPPPAPVQIRRPPKTRTPPAPPRAPVQSRRLPKTRTPQVPPRAPVSKSRPPSMTQPSSQPSQPRDYFEMRHHIAKMAAMAGEKCEYPITSGI